MILIESHATTILNLVNANISNPQEDTVILIKSNVARLSDLCDMLKAELSNGR
jgi:hypothetical protein